MQLIVLEVRGGIKSLGFQQAEIRNDTIYAYTYLLQEWQVLDVEVRYIKSVLVKLLVAGAVLHALCLGEELLGSLRSLSEVLRRTEPNHVNLQRIAGQKFSCHFGFFANMHVYSCLI